MRENTHAKRNRANHSLLSGKRFDATEDRELRPISIRCSAGFRGHASEFTLKSNALKRTKIALALPSYISTAFERHSSRLVPVSVSRDLGPQGFERVFRSDVGVAHRLSLSGGLL